MTSEAANCTGPRWLSIIGIGEDGIAGLSPVAQRLISAAGTEPINVVPTP